MKLIVQVPGLGRSAHSSEVPDGHRAQGQTAAAQQMARLKKSLLKSFLQSFKNFLHLQWLWIPDESPLLQGIVGLGGLQ